MQAAAQFRAASARLHSAGAWAAVTSLRRAVSPPWPTGCSPARRWRSALCRPRRAETWFYSLPSPPPPTLTPRCPTPLAPSPSRRSAVVRADEFGCRRRREPPVGCSCKKRGQRANASNSPLQGPTVAFAESTATFVAEIRSWAVRIQTRAASLCTGRTPSRTFALSHSTLCTYHGTLSTALLGSADSPRYRAKAVTVWPSNQPWAYLTVAPISGLGAAESARAAAAPLLHRDSGCGSRGPCRISSRRLRNTNPILALPLTRPTWACTSPVAPAARAAIHAPPGPPPTPSASEGSRTRRVVI